MLQVGSSNYEIQMFAECGSKIQNVIFAGEMAHFGHPDTGKVKYLNCSLNTPFSKMAPTYGGLETGGIVCLHQESGRWGKCGKISPRVSFVFEQSGAPVLFLNCAGYNPNGFRPPF